MVDYDYKNLKTMKVIFCPTTNLFFFSITTNDGWYDDGTKFDISFSTTIIGMVPQILNLM